MQKVQSDKSQHRPTKPFHNVLGGFGTVLWVSRWRKDLTTSSHVTIGCCISITHPLAEDPSYLLRLKLLDGLPAFPSNTFQVGRTRLPDLVYTTPLVLLLSLRLLGIMRFLLTVSLVRGRTRRASQDRGCMDICDAWRRAGFAAWCCVLLSSRRFPPISTQWDQPFCLRTFGSGLPYHVQTKWLEYAHHKRTMHFL